MIGHKRIWEFLNRAESQDKLAHALLFIGPEQVGKMALATEFAKKLLCEKPKSGGACGACRSCADLGRGSHPDLIILSAKKTEKNGVIKNSEIGIAEIRALQHQLSLFPYSAKYKIAIIEEATAMSQEAASAFLKTLEEPAKKSIIILVSSFWQTLLPTIISRCQTIKFLTVPEKEMMAGLEAPNKENVLKKVIKLSAGRPGRAIEMLSEKEELLKQEKYAREFERVLRMDLAARFDISLELSQNIILAQETLASWLIWLRDEMLRASGREELVLGIAPNSEIAKYFKLSDLVRACRQIQMTQSILNNSSANARLALEVLMTKI